MPTSTSSLRTALLLDMYARTLWFEQQSGNARSPAEALESSIGIDTLHDAKAILREFADFWDGDGEALYSIDKEWTYANLLKLLDGFDPDILPLPQRRRKLQALSARLHSAEARSIGQSGLGGITRIEAEMLDCLPATAGELLDPSLPVDFVSDPGKRRMLADDFMELSACLRVGAFKASIILAGAMMEHVLLDLVKSRELAASMPADELLSRVTPPPGPLGADLRRLVGELAKERHGASVTSVAHRLKLYQLARTARFLGAISEESFDDCSVVRDYRNLVHSATASETLGNRRVGRGLAYRSHAGLVALCEELKLRHES